jgi:peptidoglycan/xylan/chitin deacetylase (PgdA/CDA1 family)
MRKIALRMDDVGASSKIYQQYGLSSFYFFKKKIRISSRITNFLFFKRISYVKGWGPYTELTVKEFELLFNFLDKNKLKMTIAITACWVNKKGELIPYYEKFNDSAKIIKNAIKSNLVEVANHGLTHCIVGKHLPHYFSTNQKYHREFWDWIPSEVQHNHLEKSQKILKNFFDCPITTFVPPGNVYTEETIKIASKVGITLINCNTQSSNKKAIKIIGNEKVIDFHDREIKLYGLDWLNKKVNELPNKEFCFVRNLT